LQIQVPGQVTLYFRDNSGNWSYSQLNLGTDIVGNANFGASVAISADASTIVVGGNGDNNGVGAVWVYKRVGTTNQYNQLGNKFYQWIIMEKHPLVVLLLFRAMVAGL